MPKKKPRLTKREQKDQAIALGGRPRIIERQGTRLHASAGASAEAIDVANEFFAEKGRHGGPAQQMMDFVEPLMAQARAEGDLEAMNKVMSFGMIFWNLAILHGETRVEALKKAEEALGADDDAREAFLAMAQQMIARHEAMFPWLHERAR